VKIDIREWLYSVREKNRYRRSIMYELECVNSDIETLRGVQGKYVDASFVRGSYISNPTQKNAIEIIDKYIEKANDLMIELSLIDDEIDTIKKQFKCMSKAAKLNSNEYNAMKYYYFEGMSNAEVAKAMHYSEVWVKTLKKRGYNLL